MAIAEKQEIVDSLLVRRERGEKREKEVTGGTLLLSLFLVWSGL